MTTLIDDEPRYESTITSIKSAVARSLASADDTVEVKTTDYFNNTYVPDMVLKWRSTGESRLVFLRTNADVDYLIDDFSAVAERSPIVVSLADIDDRANQTERIERLQEASLRSRLLVAQPASFSALGERRSNEPVVGMASSSLLHGGNGYVPPARATQFGDSLARGFDAARVFDQDGTATAVQLAENILDGRRADEVTSFLHAVWVGSGGDGTTFPSGRGVTAHPTGRALDLLLATVEIDDRAFWTRMARSLTFAKLAEITATTEHLNFQHLMRAATNILLAKAMRVVESVPATHDGARWFVDQGTLGLRYRTTTAIFAASRKGDLSTAGIEDFPPLSTLQLRAERAGIALTDVTVGTEARRLDYGSEDGGAITRDSQLARFADALGPRAFVRRATARVGHRDLLVDFESSTVHGRTAATYYLAELVQHLPLFVDFSREQIAEVLSSALGEDEPAPQGEDSE